MTKPRLFAYSIRLNRSMSDAANAITRRLQLSAVPDPCSRESTLLTLNLNLNLFRGEVRSALRGWNCYLQALEDSPFITKAAFVRWLGLSLS